MLTSLVFMLKSPSLMIKSPKFDGNICEIAKGWQNSRFFEPQNPHHLLNHRTSFPMRLISLTRLRRRPWRARCSAQLVPVAPSSPVPVAVVPEPPVEEPGECATFRWGIGGGTGEGMAQFNGKTIGKWWFNGI